MKDCLYLPNSDDTKEVGTEEESIVSSDIQGKKQANKGRKRKTKKAQRSLQMELPIEVSEEQEDLKLTNSIVLQ